MDFIKFNPVTSPTKLENAQVLNNLKSVTWIERYRDPSEFTIVANVESGMKDILPLGSFISHTSTTEVMIVENHEIVHNKGEPREITITGRSYETYFEHRIVASNMAIFPTTSAAVEYLLTENYTWDQAVIMINDHAGTGAINPDDVLTYTTPITDIVGSSVFTERYIQRGNLHKALMDLLAIDGLGIKAVRPGAWSPLGAASEDVAFLIYVGTDRSNEITFSFDSNAIDSANYLWSNKAFKNCAYITGRWVEAFATPLFPAPESYDRRVMHVDGSDIDNAFESAPAGGDLTAVHTAMVQRGLDALYSQNAFTIVRAEASKPKELYRVSYDLGDWIMVQGDYDTASIMQVTEHVEIKDENGIRAYPTLSIVS